MTRGSANRSMRNREAERRGLGLAASRPKRALVRLALLLGSVFLSALVLEVGVLLAFGEQVKFPRHVVGSEFGLRINQPNSTYRHKSADVTVWFRINGQGMRADRDFSYEKPEGVKRIVALGDSFTLGYEVDAEKTFSSILERELNDRGHAVEVLNAGVSGYSTAEAALYLERELLRYDPDLVVVSFYGNDPVDNVRSNLFSLVNDRLVEGASSYVPAGRVGDFLNTSSIFNFLSERSNAFALLKEKATLLAKRRMVMENVETLEQAEATAAAAEDKVSYQRRLAGATFERIYRTTDQRQIPLIIQSIPSRRTAPERLVERFPLEEFDVTRKGVWFLPAKEVLDPWLGQEQLYHERSHGHWTPHSMRSWARLSPL